MGFDTECVLNIQSLPGEYFCPLCRLLVYPNEGLQSLCTHLYCKPCLSYIASTSRACPYCGYLVTEADSKPIIESNKPLSEAIGKVTVRCLYQRSGCTWQGSLAECTTHCSACAFGNSPVVCNRCAVQIVHRQVQEHAQNCPGVPQQAQNVQVAQDSTTTTTTTTTTGATAVGDQSHQTQATTQAGAVAPQAQTSTTSSVPGQDPSLQVISTTQTQSAVQAAPPTTDQWYQQQQQFQQYYQQYQGYDPTYQQQYQQYYPYQQQAVPQYQQPQGQVQPQALLPTQQYSQPQAQPQIQLPVASQPQSQAQVNLQQPQPQSQSQVQLAPLGHPQSQPNPQVQISQYQLPHSQVQHLQPQISAQAHPQHQTAPPPQSNAQPLQTPSQYPLHPLPQSFTSQPNQPVNLSVQPQTQNPSVHAVTGHQSFPQPQVHQQIMLGGPQPSVYMHSQGLQLPTQHPTPAQMQSQLPQQSPLLGPPLSHGIVQNPQQPSLVPSPGKVPNVSPSQQLIHAAGVPVQQRPVMQPAQQTMNQSYTQHHQLFSGQPWGPGQNQIQPQVPYAQQQQQQQQQQQLLAPAQLRPQGLPQTIQQPSHTHQQAQQTVALGHGMQPNQSVAGRPTLQFHGVPMQSYPQPAVAGLQVRPMQIGANQQSGNILGNNSQVQMSSQEQSAATSRPIPERQGDAIIEKGAGGEFSSQKAFEKDHTEIKTVKSGTDLKLADEGNKPTGQTLSVEYGKASIKQVKEEPAEGSDDRKDIANIECKQAEVSASEGKGVIDGTLLKAPLEREGKPLDEQNIKLRPAGVQGGGIVQQTQYGLSSQQRPVGPSLLQALPPGPAHRSQFPGRPPTHFRPLGPGHPFNPPPEHLQQPLLKPPHGPEISPGGIAGPGSTLGIGKTPSQGPNHADGRQSDPQHSNMRMDGATAFDSSSMIGWDDKSRPFTNEHLNPLSQDLKHFPRPSHMDAAKFGNHFSSSRHLDRGSHGFGLDAGPRTLERGSRGLKFDSEINMDALGTNSSARFFPPPHNGSVHPTDAREKPMNFPSKSIGRGSAHIRPDFLGSVPGYGRHHMDDLAAPRSPGRDYPGIYPHGIGAPPSLDDMTARESRRFGDPLGSSFGDSRFPVLPIHLRGGEFEGSVETQASHLLRGEQLGTRDLLGPLRFGDPIGFGGFPGPAQMGESAGPAGLSHPRFGEPGFRSSFSLRRFPGDVGSYAGDSETFDNSRKRKAPSMGWCRICKVDCETVEGLDLHSQTREHQKMALDMVAVIKRNAKKQKSGLSDHSSLDDGSKSRNTGSQGRGNKH